MTKQPKALLLADELDAGENFYAESSLRFDFKLCEAVGDSAAELRRLHEVNQELLDALLRIMRHIPADFGGASFSDDWWKAQRIIAKATGEQQ